MAQILLLLQLYNVCLLYNVMYVMLEVIYIVGAVNRLHVHVHNIVVRVTCVFCTVGNMDILLLR